MSPLRWWIVSAGTILAGLIAWPARPATSRSLPAMLGPALRRRAELPWPLLAAACGTLAAAVRVPVLVAGSVGIVIFAAASAIRLTRASIRRVKLARDMAALAAVLANQAAVTADVPSALAAAAPLIAGPVGDAAADMARECETSGIEQAAHRFARQIPAASSVWLADIVIFAASGGSAWADVIDVFAVEASEVASTQQRFHSSVAASLPQLVTVLAVSVGLIAAAGLMSGDIGRWLISPQGSLVSCAAAVLAGVAVARILLPAKEFIR